MWLLYAFLGALTAAIVTVLTKAGLKNTDANLAFAIQSVLILIVTWSVAWVQGSTGKMAQVGKKEWVYLVIAGVVTAMSSLFTFRALKLGNASVVSPIERASLVFAVIFAAVFLKERITWPIVLGSALIVAGAIIIAVSQKPS